MSGGAPTEYEEVVVDSGNSILPDTTLSPGADYLYVLSTSKVNKKIERKIILFSIKLYTCMGNSNSCKIKINLHLINNFVSYKVNSYKLKMNI